MFPASNPVGSLNQNRRAKGIPFDSYSSGSAIGGGRRPSFIQTEVQGLPDRLFPYRHRGGPNRSGQALSHPRHRPDLEFAFVELHEKAAPHRRGLPASPDRRRPLQGRHDPYRQRNPLHHARQCAFGRARHQGIVRRDNLKQLARYFEILRQNRRFGQMPVSS